MTSRPDADERLVAAHDLALTALREITPASTIGPAAGYLLEEDGTVSLRFENRLPGYPGWHWTVTVARVDDSEPTVLEVELLPGDGALLAPEWVPWVERLAEYRANQAELAEQAAGSTSVTGDATAELDEGDELEDDLDLDDDDLDDDDEDHEADILHAGDLDGVDIDELDDSGDDLDEPEDVDGASDDAEAGFAASGDAEEEE